ATRMPLAASVPSGSVGCPTRVPDDLPEMPVRIAEVAGVDAPGSVMGRRHDRAGGSGLPESPVDFGAARDQLAEAELADLRRAGGYRRVLGELGTRVEGEQKPVLEREDDDRARRARLLVDEVGRDHALRLQAEAVAIEDERAVEVVDCECDDVQARLHRSVSSLPRTSSQDRVPGHTGGDPGEERRDGALATGRARDAGGCSARGFVVGRGGEE